VILVALLALAVCAFSAYRTLSHVEFKEVKAGTGSYIHVESNHNNTVDLNLETEFKPSKNGNYIKQNALDVLLEIPFSAGTVGCLLLAMLAMVGRDLGYIWRIRILTKNELNWRSAFRTIMIWEYASALAPGVMSGATVAMFILNRERIKLGRATAIVITTAFFDNLFFVVMIPVVLCIYPYDLILPVKSIGLGGSTAFWTGYTMFFILTVMLFISIFIFPSFMKNVLNAITKVPFLKRWNEKANETGENVRITALEFKKQPVRFWARIGLATVASWTSRYLVISFIFQAFVSLGFAQHLLLLCKQFVLWMFMRIAPTPGGSGVAEWAFGELLSTFSASVVIVGSLAVLWRVIGYFPYLIIGSILLPRWLGSNDK
jgi:uncharacterized protein (TIRG00374 family)